MSRYQLDRNAFRMYPVKDAPQDYLFCKNKLFEEKLKAANYLDRGAYNFPENDPPGLDRIYFKNRKRK